MNDTDRALDTIRHAADALVPALTERLERHGLGEIEVRHGDLRLRIAGVAAATPAAGAASAAGSGARPSATTGTGGPSAAAPGQPSPIGVTSPAVGFFVYADGLGPGQAVAKGDPVGHVEMLGVRHEVRAPRAGTVGHLVAESGEAVEYGQVVVEIEPGESAR